MHPILRLAAALALVMTASGAIADVTFVRLRDGSAYFYGQLASAATPARLDAYIECGLDRASLACRASDGQGGYASCTTTDANVKKMFPMMDRSSLVQVFHNNAGTCTKMAVVNVTRDLRLTAPAGAINIPMPVVVAPQGTFQGNFAYGAIGTRPSVPGSNEAISCGERSDGFIQCVATDSFGQTAGCVSFRDSPQQTIADQRLAISALIEFSYLSFTFDNATPQANCVAISVINASYFAPQ